MHHLSLPKFNLSPNPLIKRVKDVATVWYAHTMLLTVSHLGKAPPPPPFHTQCMQCSETGGGGLNYLASSKNISYGVKSMIDASFIQRQYRFASNSLILSRSEKFCLRKSKMAATHAVFTSFLSTPVLCSFTLKTYSKYVLYFSQSYFIINYWEKRRRKVFAFD